MYTSQAQSIISTLKPIIEAADAMNSAYEESCKEGERIQDKYRKVRDEKDELTESLEEAKEELETLRAENARLIEQAASYARVTDALRSNIVGFQKDMDGSGRIIDELKAELEQYKEYAAYAHDCSIDDVEVRNFGGWIAGIKDGSIIKDIKI